MTTPAEAPPKAISVKTAAELLEVSEWTIREHITAGELPSYKVGRAIRIDLADYTAWVQRLKDAA